MFALSALFLSAAFGGAQAYNPTEALDRLWLSYSTYEGDVSALQDWTCACCQRLPGVSDISLIFDKTQETFGLVAKNKDSSIGVAFRGTDDLTNWIEDIKSAVHTNYYSADGQQHGRAADGFYKAWETIQTDIIDHVKSLAEGNLSQEIQVTGHSLGAALSTLCAARLAELGFTNIHLYNFGDPRVGDHTFQEYFMGLSSIRESWRVVNQKDIVPHLPPYDADFWHIGTEVWYPDSVTSFKVCNGSGEDQSCSDSVDLPISVYDHTHYLGYHDDDCTYVGNGDEFVGNATARR